MSNTLDIKNAKNFLANNIYLKKLIENIKDKSDIDSNIFYELVLGKLKYEKILKNCDDEQIVKECRTMIDSIELVIGGFTKEELSNILSKETKSIQKYDKIKYYNLSETMFNGKLKRAYEVVDSNSSIKYYLKRKGLKICILTFLTIFLVGFGFDYCYGMLDKVCSIMTNTGNIYNKAIDSLFANMGKAAISISFYLILISNILGMSIDMLYINIPFFRYTVKEELRDKLVSSDAIDAVMVESNDNRIVRYRSIKNTNRIRRNEEILQYLMIKNPGNMKLKRIHKEIEDCKDTKLFYNKMAKMEFVLDEMFKQGELITD